jgi:hypothetical protein
MNEKIEELIEQTGLAIDIFGNPIWGNVGTPIAQKQFLEKFSESIVKECAEVLLRWKGEPFPFDEDLAVSLIKEHFGVE